MGPLANQLYASPMLQDLVYRAGMIPYYPSEKYLRRGWAPEEMHRDSLLPLIEAEKRAVKSGVLPASLANAILPTAMVEGWDNNYGVVGSQYGYPPSPRRDAVMDKMGLRVAEMPEGAGPADFYQNVDMLRGEGGYWVPSGKYLDDPKGAHYAAAALVPIIMAEKARIYGADKMTERWNGRGRAFEDDADQWPHADAKNHARKVEEARRMLLHPANKRLYDEYLYRMLTE